jgi:hypothetical protein
MKKWDELRGQGYVHRIILRDISKLNYGITELNNVSTLICISFEPDTCSSCLPIGPLLCEIVHLTIAPSEWQSTLK